jgi:RNA polymerase sigma factor (TIGR02999 family)
VAGLKRSRKAEFMSPPTSGEVTRLLREIQDGNEGARRELFALVYEELHRIAESFMRRERPDHTLQPTALVNEVFCRLLDSNVFARNRAYFFCAVAEAMRQILREHERKRRTKKSGGDWVRTPYDEILDRYERRKIDVSHVDEALKRLKDRSPRQYEVVNLRYFAGRKMQEIADILDVSITTVENNHRAAKAFLRGLLDEGG